MEDQTATATLSKVNQSALPAAWIERLFERLFMIYGTDKMQGLWRGQEMADVKKYWAAELAGFSGDELRDGFSKLRREHPEWPPTLYQFVDLCRAAVKLEAHKALPWPKVDPATTDPRIAALRDALKMPKSDPLAWSKKLLQRHADGDKTVDPYALRMARDAERIAAGGQVRQ
jgi:hypothetical protein